MDKATVDKAMVQRTGPMTGFHPAVRTWFERRFPEGPTAAQAEGWPHVAAGEDTLIAAPTGSGKTLAGFLVAIDALYRRASAGEVTRDRTQVVYVSPLKALAVDIRHNLVTPLDEIAEVATELGMDPPALSAEVRNGDTAPSARAAMLRHPPNFLVTTPESLYLMVTSPRSRSALATVETVIVDEIHSVARDKRGSHLALTLERLERLCESRPLRVGLSATQRPVAAVARLLVGAGADRSMPDGSPRCAIIDVGHRRDMNLSLELPQGELEAVASGEQMGDVIERVAAGVLEHKTTLVFVNTRRMAERLAHLLGERLGDDVVAAHHGSLSKDRRHRVESRLRAGDLRALVATASLELGIDIGPIDLVCQIGSPRSIATFLQRVGRSGHTVRGTPTGWLFPMTRDELVECAALMAGVRAGILDALAPPVAPLDILAQQLVAECSAERQEEEGLFAMARRAAPFSELEREDFDDVVDLVSGGIMTGRGRRAAYLHRDGVNARLSGRRGARLAALTSGGAIPETGDYRVVADPDDILVGTVNEDWAIESMAGDVFLLGTASWRIRRVEPGTVRVVDAAGAPPTVPFWLGEAPARTDELSAQVSALRRGVEELVVSGGERSAIAWVCRQAGISEEAGTMVVRYLAAARRALGCLPTQDVLVVERFFDETESMQLVVHSPFGARVNRALGLALRKRFCVSFDFELQAAASDDAVLLSLGPQHSFPLESLPRFLSSKTVEQVVRQAVLASPMFQARWRWNLNRSLAVLRFRGGRKNPPQIQRMEADDLMASVFPALAACQENTTGPIAVPDHVLVRQTMYDCLHEAMDIAGLCHLVERIERGSLQVNVRDTTEPSPLAHEILNGRPYTFLDDAPLEERRSRAVNLPRGIPEDGVDLAALDPEAITRVREEVRPDPRDPDELHDLLLSLVVVRALRDHARLFADLVADGRAMRVRRSDPTDEGSALWCAAERLGAVRVLFPGARVEGCLQTDARAGSDAPAVQDAGAGSGGPAGVAREDGPGRIDGGRDELAAMSLRGHLDTMGPTTVSELERASGLSPSVVAIALARLVAEGFVIEGHFETDRDGAEQGVCARRLLARIHRYTRRRLRARVRPVTAQDYMRFLLSWHGLSGERRRRGPDGLLEVIDQLQGFELPTGAWESDVLPARVSDYRGELLDRSGLAGELAWGRLSVRVASTVGSGDRAAPSRSAPSRATPITMARREDLPWLLLAARAEASPQEPAAGATRDVLDALRRHGALFRHELAEASGRLPFEVTEALWDGMARGILTADGFAAMRALLSSRSSRPRRPQRRRLRSAGRPAVAGEGRWALLPPPAVDVDPDDLADTVAEQLLARWGVVVRDVLARETLALPWREVLFALRRMEARGTALGGRFVTGFAGEQFALPEVATRLRSVEDQPRDGSVVQISAADPLNLVGIILPGARIPAVLTNTVAYQDGLPVAPHSPAGTRAATLGA